MQTETTDKNSTVCRYLPLTLQSNWAKAPSQNPIWGEWLEGSLMHCDVTGFTAMNEALAKMGHEGAEVMAKILNQFFERMLKIGEEWNGIQMKFGGDAMLLYFPDEQHAICAARCGLAMQSAMKDFSKVLVNDDVCQLRMRIGVHSGRFYSASIGEDEGLLHYLLTGHDVNRAADVEPLAEPGQVVVSDETAVLLKGHGRLSATKHEGIWEVKFVDAQGVAISKLDISNAPSTTLSRYLIPSIANGRASNLRGEHRRATIAFIYLFGLSDLIHNSGESEALSQANKYLQLVLSTAEKYSGSLLTSDVAEHADKLVVCFGVPVSTDNQEKNCLRFSHELNEKLRQGELNLRHQIGINSGFVFAGEIGSSWRSEYTAIGDNMNLAARLMAAAGEGNILVSSNTSHKVGKEFEFEILEPIKVKGKSKPIQVSRLININEFLEPSINANDSKFVGRDTELKELFDLSKVAKSYGPASVFVTGDPGIGKTSLCDIFLSRLQYEGWLTMHSICQSYNVRNVYSAWKYPLSKLLNITQLKSDKDKWDTIQSAIQKFCPKLIDFSPLIAEMLSISHEKNPVVNSLDSRTKSEKRVELVKSLIMSIAKVKPLCFFFDNANYMDSSSTELVKHVLSQEDLSLCMIFASRMHDPLQGLFDREPDLHINLQALSVDASKLLVSYIADFEQSLVDRVAEKSGGNPLFIKELIQSGHLHDEALPDSIHDIVMVKLDRLDGEERSALRNAAVIGQVFDLDLLNSIYRSA